MTLEEARKILGDSIKADGALCELAQYMSYCPGGKTVNLDGDFSADECEAIAVCMRATPSGGTVDG